MAQFPGKHLTVRRLSVYHDNSDSHDSIMSSPPDWVSYVRAGGENGPFLDEEGVELIREYENQPEDSVVEIHQTEGTGPAYAKVLLRVLKNVSNERVIKYTLTLVEDLLVPNLAEHAMFFAKDQVASTQDLLTGNVAETTAAPQTPNLDVDIFLTFLDHDSVYVRQKAFHILSLLFSVRPSPQDTVSNYIGRCISVLEDSDQDMLSVVVRSLTVLLRHPRCKALFHQRGGVKLLVGLTRTHMSKMQLLYELSWCIWLLALHEPAIPAFDHAVLDGIVKLIASEPRVKVVRMAFSTLKIVLDHHSREKEVSEALIEKGMLKLVDNWANKQGNDDPDLIADLNGIKEKLLANFRVLNTFERHEQELLTERLEPGSVHTEKFWKENVRSFEKDDFGSIKKLVNLLHSEFDTTAALACSDLGFFVQYYPNGKAIVERMGGKKHVMALLAHKNGEVQKQALLCCSKMMVTNWEFLRLN